MVQDGFNDAPLGARLFATTEKRCILFYLSDLLRFELLVEQWQIRVSVEKDSCGCRSTLQFRVGTQLQVQGLLERELGGEVDMLLLILLSVHLLV